MSSINSNPSNPLAVELNEIIANESPTVYDLLSVTGQEIYYPTKGIIAQSAEAKESADPRYNATVGIATDSEGPLVFPSIKKFFNLDLLKPSEIFDYSPTYGQATLRKLWKKHIEILNPDVNGKDISLPVVGGGLTHCISVSGGMFFNEGDTLILPDQIWGNYRLFYHTLRGVKIKQFPFLNRTGFNLSAFKKITNEEAKCSKQVKLILNFPNNPTGYTPTHKEAIELGNHLIRLANQGNRILVILDEAYFGLFFEDDSQKQSLFARFADAHKNLLCVKICGMSKEFFSWGFRIGFITVGIKGGSPKLYQAIEKKIGGMIRATVSNCSSVSQNVLTKLLQKQDYVEDLKNNFNILKARANRIKEILHTGKYQDAFEAYPFNSGYFMLIKLKNGVESEVLRKELLQKEKIGTISTGQYDLRIAFSCLEINDIDYVFDKIYATAKTLSKKGTSPTTKRTSSTTSPRSRSKSHDQYVYYRYQTQLYVPISQKKPSRLELFFYFNSNDKLVGVSFHKNVQLFPNAIQITDIEKKKYIDFIEWFESFLYGKTTLKKPIHLSGTPFQKKVWNYLLTIPRGKITSYKEIAHAIGNPSAYRAVGTAVGKNPYSVIIPCHRVLHIGKNKIGKFGGGESLKKKLLELEGVVLEK